MVPMMLMMSLLSLLQLMMMKIWLVGGGGAPRGAVEARVPFSKHINVARAVFRPQNRWKRYLYTWVMGFSVFFCDFWMVLVFCLCFLWFWVGGFRVYFKTVFFFQTEFFLNVSFQSVFLQCVPGLRIF